MKRFIYADNAATTKMSERASEAMVKFQLENFANASQPYSFARSAKNALRESRESIARCIGASPDEIFFTSCGTESNNWVIKCAECFTYVTSPIEHHAVLNACEQMVDEYSRHYLLPVDRMGIVTPDAVETQSAERWLVSVMMANNEIGTIQPIKELASAAHRKNALFHTDAVQAVGHIPIDVKDLDVDFLSASAHKFNGPKGVGFLYKKSGINLKPFIAGGAQESGLRAGTENVAAIVAMAIALQENVEQMDEHKKNLQKLENVLLHSLCRAGVCFSRNGSNNRIPGNVSLSFAGQSGEALLHRLDFKGVCVSTGSACDSNNTQISHVLKAIGLDDYLAKGTIRISFGKDNTDDDARYIANCLSDILK